MTRSRANDVARVDREEEKQNHEEVAPSPVERLIEAIARCAVRRRIEELQVAERLRYEAAKGK